MTRNCNRPPMELDLDAFLQSHDASTSDDEDDHHHRTTVDELLLIDSDGSDVNSPRNNTDPFDANSSDYLLLTTSQLGTDGDRPEMHSRIPSISQLPRLFSTVRSNAKPGAALAAAAAASRLVPTPHAAAIKLTREKSSTESLDPKANIASEIGHSEANFVDEDLQLDHLDTASVELTGNSQLCGEMITEHENKNACSLDGEGLPSEELATDITSASGLDGFDLDLRDDALSSSAKPEISSPSILDNVGMRSALDSISVSSEKNDAENLELHEKGAEVDDKPAQRDAFVDMGSIVIPKGSGKSDGGTRGTSLTPLQYAEELEKKHAFTGLHWEEGAAAQPMKLEGVHMGSTALAYFSTSTDNTITRTISSSSFKRDHGTPQALAVHLNYIAVGMSRGLIVVVPSKYSPDYADNMDAKMLMLGLQGDRSSAPVTSMSFNHQGDLLFAGYADGHYTVGISKVSLLQKLLRNIKLQ